MNEQEKTVEEAAVDYVANHYTNHQYNAPSFVRAGFIAGAHWQQSDPAFIESVVRQTLEYVATEIKEQNEAGVVLTPQQIPLLHPEIVNNIIKKK